MGPTPHVEKASSKMTRGSIAKWNEGSRFSGAAENEGRYSGRVVEGKVEIVLRILGWIKW
jgi:hypothetical protein